MERRIHRLLVLAAIFIVSAATQGFRPVEEFGEEFLQEVEEAHFTVRSHAELYDVVTFRKTGEIVNNRLIIAYRYDEDEVVGVFRILPNQEQPGAIAMLKQVPGKIPEIYLRDPKLGINGLVPLEERKHIWLGETGWYLEDIYDDDKSEWEYTGEGYAVFRGVRTEIIRSEYKNPRMARNSISAYRKLYLAADDRRFLNLEFYNEEDELQRSFATAIHQTFVLNGKQQKRPLRLEIHDYEHGILTVAQRISSNFKEEIPREYFTNEYLIEKWRPQTDQQLIAMMEKVSE